MAIVEISNLTKDYEVGFWRKRKVRALDDLSLSVDAGQIFGFLGANGAGKTTTLKLLMRLIRPTSGTARILGEPIESVEMHRHVGYLPEQAYFYDYLTARELLWYFGRLTGIDDRTLATRVDATLDRVGLDRKTFDRQLRKFSKGMLQRVGLAQAIVNDPTVVFLDEPMSGLDPLGRREVRSLILELRDQGRTVFFSSHILADAEALCSRVAVVAGGRLAATGRLSDILAFEIRGWELVIADLRPEVLARIAGELQRATEISPQRYALELPLQLPPERILPDLTATGARLVSLNPIRDTLEDTGYWGQARVLPRDGTGMDVYIDGKIIESTGREIKLDITVTDATGRTWFTKVYEADADLRAYKETISKPRDPFDNVYNTLANDLLAARRKLTTEQLVQIRDVAELRFANDLAPYAFSSYLSQDRKGVYKVVRLPAPGDPMMERMDRVRERDYTLVDTSRPLDDALFSYLAHRERTMKVR